MNLYSDSSPVVSVLINNYNYAPYVAQCINSVINQTYQRVETIIYDDSSTDSSMEVIEQYRTLIKIIRGKIKQKFPSQNQMAGINAAFEQSRGDIICLLDSDDYFTENKVARIVDSYNTDQNCVLVQHASIIVEDNVETSSIDYAYHNTNYRELYFKKNWTAFYNPTSTLTFRRSYLEKILPMTIDKYWRVWPDVRLSRPAPFFGEIISLPDKLSYYRKHHQSDSFSMNRNSINTFLNQTDHHRYLNDFLNIRGLPTIRYHQSFNYFKKLLKCVIPINFERRYLNLSNL